MYAIETGSNKMNQVVLVYRYIEYIALVLNIVDFIKPKILYLCDGKVVDANCNHA